MLYFLVVFSVLAAPLGLASELVSCSESLLLQVPGSVRVFGHCKDWDHDFSVLSDKHSDVDEYLEKLSNLFAIVRSGSLYRTARHLYLRSFYDYSRMRNQSTLPQKTKEVLDYLEKYHSEELK